MKTFDVIRQDAQHFDIYDPTARKVVTTIGLEADALSLKVAMDAGDTATIQNLFFLTENMREDALKAMQE